MTRRKLDDFEARIRAAGARRQAEAAAIERVACGGADLHDYQLVCQESIRRRRDLTVASLTVVRAQRRAGVRSAEVDGDFLATVRAAMSYLPNEALPWRVEQDLRHLQAAATATGALTTLVDAGKRASAAISYLIIGPDNGTRMRQRVWNSGLAEEAARTTLADYEVSCIANLLHDWSPWINEARRNRIETGQGDPGKLDSMKFLVPLQLIAELLEDGLWSRP